MKEENRDTGYCMQYSMTTMLLFMLRHFRVQRHLGALQTSFITEIINKQVYLTNLTQRTESTIYISEEDLR